MSYLSPEAERAQFDARARELAWWPTLRVTKSQVIVSRPSNGARRFADRMEAKCHNLLAFDSHKGTWSASLERIQEVYMTFAPQVHLSAGAWVALEDSGATPAGRLMLNSEEQAAIMRHDTSVEEILAQARLALRG